ncbi:MAG: alpha/beta hydrolase [Pseudomonadales bacterium]|nr:alpha/beta hydrolase [Pseudomonadales bacterium]
MGDALPKAFVVDPEVNRVGNLTWKSYIKRPGLLSDIANIQCPVTFIKGGRDIRPNWPTQQLAALIPGGRYVEIEDAHHCPWMTHPKLLR